MVADVRNTQTSVTGFTRENVDVLRSIKPTTNSRRLTYYRAGENCHILLSRVKTSTGLLLRHHSFHFDKPLKINDTRAADAAPQCPVDRREERHEGYGTRANENPSVPT